MKEVVKQVILSHKRAKKVDTTKTISGCAICVPEAQADEYREYNPDVEIIVHPDSVVGLTPKIRWVYEQFTNVIMFDDDLNAMRRTYVDNEFDEGFVVKDPDTARDIVQMTAFTAREAGCKFFGFSNSARPLDYNPMKPMKFSGYGVGGSHGFLEGYKMVIPDTVIAGQDYFLSAANAHFHRKAYINTRYAFTSKDGTFESTGGMSDFRTTETEKKDYYLLKEYFGAAIQRKKTTNMRKSLQNEYERTLKIPF